jgi:renalase
VLSENLTNPRFRPSVRPSARPRARVGAASSHRSIATTHLMRFPDVFVPAGPLFKRVHVDERTRRAVPHPAHSDDVAREVSTTRRPTTTDTSRIASMFRLSTSPRVFARVCAPLRARRVRNCSTLAAFRQGEVAVIGAGVAGVACADALARRGIKVRLYDAGRNVGGRATTRIDGESGAVWDHGTRFVELATDESDDAWRVWVEANARRWRGDFVSIECASGSTDARVKRRDLGRMERFALNISMRTNEDVDVKSSSRVVGIERRGDVTTGETSFAVRYRSVVPGQGDEVMLDEGFEAVVLADKNLASERAASIYGERPPVEGLGEPELVRALSEIDSTPIIALMVTFNRPPAVNFVGAEIRGGDRLEWITDESSKPDRPNAHSCWVAHSTAAYARSKMSERELRTKVGTSSHQEWLNEVRDEMSDALLDVLRSAESDAASASSSSPPSIPLQITFKRAHRWGAAFPTTISPAAKSQGFLRFGDVYAVGDYCTEPLGTVRAATQSGRAAALDAAERLIARSSSHRSKL